MSKELTDQQWMDIRSHLIEGAKTVETLVMILHTKKRFEVIPAQGKTEDQVINNLNDAATRMRRLADL